MSRRLIRNGWSVSQLLEEWEYRYNERLGIMCGEATPERWQIEIAEKEANEAIAELVKPPQQTLFTEKEADA